MQTKVKWEKRTNGWVLTGTQFEILKDTSDGRWDVIERGGYRCTTRYVGVAKEICERLSQSPKQ